MLESGEPVVFMMFVCFLDCFVSCSKCDWVLSLVCLSFNFIYTFLWLDCV